jgi:hypothetical protein
LLLILGSERTGENSWKFERIVYQDSRGDRVVHLFVRADEQGQVIDIGFITLGFESLLTTIAAAHGRQGTGRKPNCFRASSTEREFRLQHRVDQANCPYILHIRARSNRRLRPDLNHPDRPRSLGYLYFVWAPFGNLWDLIHDQKEEVIKQ